MSITLNDDNLKDVVAKAILDTLTPETREGLITESIKSLLKQQAGSGFTSKTPLQDAFDQAVREVTRTVALEQVKGDEVIQAQIKAMLADAWSRVSAGDQYEAMIEKLVYAIEKGLTGDRY